MIDYVEPVLMLLMAASLIVLVLVNIGGNIKERASFDLAHIKLFLVAILAIALLLSFDGLRQAFLSKKSIIKETAVVFLLLNTLLSLWLGQGQKRKFHSGDVHFFVMVALVLALINVSFKNLLINMLASVAYVLVMTVVAIHTTGGGKKSEIGLKLAMSAISLTLLFIVALIALTSHYGTLDISIIETSSLSGPVATFGLIVLLLACLNLAGLPPFHFAYVDCAEGSRHQTAFLLFSNAAIQGAMIMKPVIAILQKFPATNSIFEASLVLIACSFLILWLRAIDQRKFLRTIAYVAASLGPLFCLSVAFGKSQNIPESWYVVMLFTFLSLSLFTLYSALALMKPVNNYLQTWEDISGFGRNNLTQTLFFLIAMATIAGLPGTLGYFIKVSLIEPTKSHMVLSVLIFLSIAMGAASVMRLFVFLVAKQDISTASKTQNPKPGLTLIVAGSLLALLGLLPILR